MTNFLHWRKTTWALALWSGYIATWAVLTGSGPSMVILWWLAGLVIFRPLWFATQSAFGQGRTLDGSVRPGSTHWQVLGLHRTNRAEPGAMPVESERRRATVSEATRHAAGQLTSIVTTRAHAAAGTVPSSAERARIAPDQSAIRARALRDWEDEGGTTPLLHGP